MTLYSRLSQYLRRHHWDAISPLESLKAGWETFTADPRELAWLRAAGCSVPELLLVEPDPAVRGAPLAQEQRLGVPLPGVDAALEAVARP